MKPTLLPAMFVNFDYGVLFGFTVTPGPYRLAVGQTYHTGAEAGEMFVQGTRAGQAFLTGTVAGAVR